MNFSHWKKVDIKGLYFLTVHPDLQITKIQWENNIIVLLGFILDPHNPSRDNFGIIETLAKRIKRADDLHSELLCMGGRYVLIVKIGVDVRILNDANGMRQVFYCKDQNNELWCGSEPAILADHLKLTTDQAIKDDLFKLSFFSKKAEYWYPGNSTIYNNIHHLTPNHFIDLVRHTIVRYWPSDFLKRYSFKDAIEKSAFYLQHLMVAANNRFNLALGLSGGYDSRIVLAASKKIKENTLYFTHTINGKSPNIKDIRIPSELCKRLELKHVVITIPDRMDFNFETFFNKNVTTARESKGLNINGLYTYFKNAGCEVVLTSGNMSEISKRNARRLPRLPNYLVNDSLLTLFAEMQGSSIAPCKFREWHEAFNNNIHCKQLNVLDMFYWEQRMARWAAMTFSEMDIAFENFCPFNCRELLSTMIGLPLYYRSQPDYIFHSELVNYMWPETLQLPINPLDSSFIKHTRYFLFKTRLYDILKLLYLITIKKNQF
jgi:hypothetical protein